MKEKNKFLRLLLGVIAAFMLSIGFANIVVAESGSPQKIGFVDITKILRESKAAKNAQATLQKEIESKRAIIKEKNDKIAGMDKDLKKAKQDSPAWKEKRQKLTKEINDLNKMRVEYDEQLRKKNNEFMQKIFTDVQQIIKKIASSEKFTIILDKRSALLIEDSLDLTDKVLKTYDSQKK
ncbi:MAG: OmpH family outer membrane protein [Syntrophaceae bacterium]|nr:OmpH family outer membrane protein [Syntrophaceae bacterium]